MASPLNLRLRANSFWGRAPRSTMVNVCRGCRRSRANPRESTRIQRNIEAPSIVIVSTEFKRRISCASTDLRRCFCPPR
jgi:hypothetical protein